MVITNKTSNLGTSQVTPSNSSTQASSLDKNVPVGEGTNDFITSLSVIVHQHALQVVASWKDVPKEAKTRILANALDQFRLPRDEATKQAILNEARDLFRYRRARLHKHFEVSFKFSHNYKHWFTNISDIDKINARNKENRAKQVINHCCGRKTFQVVSYENDKVTTLVLEKHQDVEEDVDQTTIMKEAFMSIVGQKSGYCRGRGKGPKPVNKYSACIQEQLATQQREASKARRSTSELLTTLEGVQAQLMEEREKREEMEARFNE
ncbi:hypothetical protein PIB30_082657 [Stylosanthes scabra]|uniref:Uncharacterized protein n=1 Tax=Stylosanthes scabra TaxID=79078 RepID=A0ABU6UQV8_9FABA|nr:hypothetical protein [Stylosanthes scabra]